MMRSVVVVDDEFIVVEGIKAIINREKMLYDIVGFAYDGIKALEIILDKKPDIVITDIRIPGIDGLSLIETVKESLMGTVFIVISGYTDFEYARRALMLGVKGYIDKPITIEKLTSTLKRIEEQDQNVADAMELNVNQMIHYALQNNGEKLLECYPDIMEGLDKYCKNLKEYIRESYRILSIIEGIYKEKSKRVSPKSLVSYVIISELDTVQKVKQYTISVFTSIADKMMAECMGSNHRIILILLEYISNHYDKDIGLNELAEIVSLNPAYLSILFKDEVGMSYIKYITNYRMEKAKKLLLEGYKVAEVSERVGYNNYRYFCDIFKKHMGQTPNEYKGNVRKTMKT